MIHDGLCTFILCYVIKLLCYVDHFDLQKYISDLLSLAAKEAQDKYVQIPFATR